MTKIVIIIYVFIALCKCAFCASYLAVHYSGDRDHVFAFPSSEADNRFLLADDALEILSVQCDGVEIVPQVRVVLINSCFGIAPKPGGRAVYCVQLNDLQIARWVDGKRQPQQRVSYDIPMASRVIEIVYKIHSSSGKVSDANRLISYELSALDKRLVTELKGEDEKKQP